MADRTVDHLLIGGGIASGNCARWLREEGSEGSILLVGREADPPYNRPPLSKGYLSGSEAKQDSYFRPREWFEERDIELLSGVSVMGVDADAKSVTLSNGDVVSFGSALLATGANVRRLRAAGSVLEGIHYVRAYGNADGIRRDVDQVGKRVVCIGGSYIGCETAATLTAAGCECTIIMLEDLPLQSTLGAEIGRWTQKLLTSKGITLHAGEELEAFVGDGVERDDDDDDQGRVTGVVTKSGLEIPCDLVVIGAGVTPDVMLARQAGLEIGERGGILCSAQLESSVPGIYAAGDVCEYFSGRHGQHIRVEHWDVAFNHGKTVALNMLGRPTAHETVPYFWSNLSDWAEIETVGPAYNWDEVVLRGSPDDNDFSAWYLDGNKLVQALAVGRADELDVARLLIEAGGDVSSVLAEIRDESADLTSLV